MILSLTPTLTPTPTLTLTLLTYSIISTLLYPQPSTQTLKPLTLNPGIVGQGLAQDRSPYQGLWRTLRLTQLRRTVEVHGESLLHTGMVPW